MAGTYTDWTLIIAVLAMALVCLGLAAVLCVLAIKAMSANRAVERMAGLRMASEMAEGSDRLQAHVVKKAMDAWPAATPPTNGEPPPVPPVETGLRERMSL